MSELIFAVTSKRIAVEEDTKEGITAGEEERKVDTAEKAIEKARDDNFDRKEPTQAYI